jgi:hypothetical protein
MRPDRGDVRKPIELPMALDHLTEERFSRRWVRERRRLLVENEDRPFSLKALCHSRCDRRLTHDHDDLIFKAQGDRAGHAGYLLCGWGHGWNQSQKHSLYYVGRRAGGNIAKYSVAAYPCCATALLADGAQVDRCSRVEARAYRVWQGRLYIDPGY